MVNAYNAGVYPTNEMYYQNGYINNSTQNANKGIPVVTTAVVGGLAGATVGYVMGRAPKDGKVSDKTARKIFENYLEKSGAKDTKMFKEARKLLDKIDKIKDVDAYKKFAKKYHEGVKFVDSCIPMDSNLAVLRSENLSLKKQYLKNAINARFEKAYQDVKVTTEACWDKATKKFKIIDGVDKKLFDLITTTQTKEQWKKTGKYGLIGASVLGVGAYIINKFACASNKQNL